MALFGVPNPCPENDTPNGAIWHPPWWVPRGTIDLLVPSGTIYEAFGTILLMRSYTSISFYMTVTLCGSYYPPSTAGYLSITLWEQKGVHEGV